MRAQVRYFAVVTFAELLARQPTADIASWRSLAEQQLRGKPLSSIDVQLDRLTLAPYAASAGATKAAQLHGTAAWHIVADARALTVDVSPLDLLKWGAQGLLLDTAELGHMESAAQEIKFDYLQTYVMGSADRFAATLAPSVTSGAKFWATRVDDHAGANQLLVLGDDQLSAAGFAAWIERRLLPAVANTQTGASNMAHKQIAVCLPIGVDYSTTLVHVRSLRVLFANVCHAFNLPTPLPRLHVLALIDARDTEQSAEQFLIDAAARAVAAITAGIDGVCVVPFDGSDVQARRALNLQHVLALEGGFDLASDAVSGAAWVQSAVAEFSQAIWTRVAAVKEP